MASDPIAQFVNSDIFDILRILTILMAVPFAIRFQKDKESIAKRWQFVAAMIPFLTLSMLSIYLLTELTSRQLK